MTNIRLCNCHLVAAAWLYTAQDYRQHLQLDIVVRQKVPTATSTRSLELQLQYPQLKCNFQNHQCVLRNISGINGSSTNTAYTFVGGEGQTWSIALWLGSLQGKRLLIGATRFLTQFAGAHHLKGTFAFFSSE